MLERIPQFKSILSPADLRRKERGRAASPEMAKKERKKKIPRNETEARKDPEIYESRGLLFYRGNQFFL